MLGTAQFAMVLDSIVMNVSISQVVADLDTTVSDVQLAITCYTLVMAAFMLTGAKLGDIWGGGGPSRSVVVLVLLTVLHRIAGAPRGGAPPSWTGWGSA